MKRAFESKHSALPSPVLEAALDLWSQTERQHWIPVSGNSMFPLIRDCDRLLVEHGCEDVRQGDVVVFRREGTLVAHRVMRVVTAQSGRIFVTKGDNAVAFDSSIPDDQIVGKVLGIKRDEKYMSLDTSSWQMLGESIAYATLTSERLFDWGSPLKRRFLGAQSGRIASFLRRSILVSFSLARQAMQVVAFWGTLNEKLYGYEREPISDTTRTLLCTFAAADLTRPMPCLDADWEEVFDGVCRNGLLGLAYRYQEQGISRDSLPLEFRRRIQHAFRSNAIRMAVLYRNVFRLLAQLKEVGIPFMVVKGPALAYTVYPEASLRTFGDLDLVVRERDWMPMHQWLVESGFRPEYDWPQPPPKLVPQAVPYEMKYWHSETKLLVEVHYDDLLNAGLASRDIEGFWRRAVAVNIEGIPIQTLALEDQLVHLCAHAHYHGYTRLNWFSDLVFIIRDHAASINWNRLLETVRKEESQVPVYYSLYFLERLLGVRVPANVLAALKPDCIRRRLHEHYLPEHRVLSLQPMSRPIFSFYFIPLFQRLLPDLLVMGRRGDKLRYLLRLLFPPRVWLRSHYKLDATRGIAIHYLLHPLKLAHHYLGEIIQEVKSRVKLRPASRGLTRQRASDIFSDL